MEIDFFWGKGLVDLEKAGEQRTVRAQPGSRVIETVPLPAPGTLVRAAGRASAGRDRGQRSLIMALEAQPPLVAPHELEGGLLGFAHPGAPGVMHLDARLDDGALRSTSAHELFHLAQFRMLGPANMNAFSAKRI